jgi:hypothetical protein
MSVKELPVEITLIVNTQQVSVSTDSARSRLEPAGSEDNLSFQIAKHDYVFIRNLSNDDEEFDLPETLNMDWWEVESIWIGDKIVIPTGSEPNLKHYSFMPLQIIKSASPLPENYGEKADDSLCLVENDLHKDDNVYLHGIWCVDYLDGQQTGWQGGYMATIQAIFEELTY